MTNVPEPGTPEFSAAIDAASSVAAIDALRDCLAYSAAEFCRRADVNESWYSRAKREGRRPRPKTIRRLREALRRLHVGGDVVPLRAVQ